MQIVPKSVIQKHSNWKAKKNLPLLQEKETILDFGCGDLSFARDLKNNLLSLSITGVDVLNTISPMKEISYIKYDGITLPFKDNTFDTVISFYVFHHCDDVEKALQECIRVARKRIIIGESTFRHPLEIPFMRFIDWLANVVKLQGVSLPYTFYSEKEWRDMFRKYNLNLLSQEEINKPPFSLLPIGKGYIFEVKK